MIRGKLFAQTVNIVKVIVENESPLKLIHQSNNQLVAGFWYYYYVLIILESRFILHAKFVA